MARRRQSVGRLRRVAMNDHSAYLAKPVVGTSIQIPSEAFAFIVTIRALCLRTNLSGFSTLTSSADLLFQTEQPRSSPIAQQIFAPRSARKQLCGATRNVR
jgi:hypothetical protein